MKKLRSYPVYLLVLVLIAGLLSGCGSKNNEQDSGKEISVGILIPANLVDDKKDLIIQAINKKLNIKLNLVNTGWDQFDSKASLAIQSKDTKLDIVQFENLAMGVKWAKDGVIYDIGELIKGKESKYPYINSIINSKTFSGMRVNDKAYFIPIAKSINANTLYVRKDWLDQYNIPIPTNTDEFYNAMQTIVAKQPGGEGTIGYQTNQPSPTNFGSSEMIAQWYGGMFEGPPVIRNGKVVIAQVQPETLDAILFFNKMYNAKIINRDFITNRMVSVKYMYANKAAALTSASPMILAKWTTAVKKLGAKPDIYPVPPFAAPGHTYMPQQEGMFQYQLCIPKTCKNPERVLDLIEFINSREGRELVICGIKGLYYNKLENGVYDRIRSNWEKDYNIKNDGYDYPLWWRFTSSVHGYIPVDKYPDWEEAQKNCEIFMSDVEAKEAVNWKTIADNKLGKYEVNLFRAKCFPEIQDTIANIDNNIKAVYFQKMLTAKDETEVRRLWDEYIAAWKKAGGEKILSTYQKYYDGHKADFDLGK